MKTDYQQKITLIVLNKLKEVRMKKAFIFLLVFMSSIINSYSQTLLYKSESGDLSVGDGSVSKPYGAIINQNFSLQNLLSSSFGPAKLVVDGTTIPIGPEFTITAGSTGIAKVVNYTIPNLGKPIGTIVEIGLDVIYGANFQNKLVTGLTLKFKVSQSTGGSFNLELVSPIEISPLPLVKDEIPTTFRAKVKNSGSINFDGKITLSWFKANDLQNPISTLAEQLNLGSNQECTLTRPLSKIISEPGDYTVIVNYCKQGTTNWIVISSKNVQVISQVNSNIAINELQILNPINNSSFGIKIQPNSCKVKLLAKGEGGNTSSIDNVKVFLKSSFSDYYRFDVTLTETGVNTNIYTGTAIIKLNQTSGNSVSVVETKAFGDGDIFMNYGTSRGKSHGNGSIIDGSINEYPSADVNSMKSAGFEKILLDTELPLGGSHILPFVYVKNSAKWFMYSGDGLSTNYCSKTGGYVDLYEHDYSCEQIGCYPTDITENDWQNVEIIVFACCSMFDDEKWYGLGWFSKSPNIYLGYRGSAPGTLGNTIIKRWKALIDEGKNYIDAWMTANKESKAWNASAYDKTNKKFWYFSSFFHNLNSSDLTAFNNRIFVATSNLGSNQSQNQIYSVGTTKKSLNSDVSEKKYSIINITGNMQAISLTLITPSGANIDLANINNSTNILPNKVVSVVKRDTLYSIVIENPETGKWKVNLQNNSSIEIPFYLTVDYSTYTLSNQIDDKLVFNVPSDFKTIQSAIDSAKLLINSQGLEQIRIMVAKKEDGTDYKEEITLYDKIWVIANEPVTINWNGSKAIKCEAVYSGGFVGPFTITGAKFGVFLTGGSSPIFSGVLIQGNDVGIKSNAAMPLLNRITVTNNCTGVLIEGSSSAVTMRQSIISGNSTNITYNGQPKFSLFDNNIFFQANVNIIGCKGANKEDLLVAYNKGKSNINKNPIFDSQFRSTSYPSYGWNSFVLDESIFEKYVGKSYTSDNNGKINVPESKKKSLKSQNTVSSTIITRYTDLFSWNLFDVPKFEYHLIQTEGTSTIVFPNFKSDSSFIYEYNESNLSWKLLTKGNSFTMDGAKIVAIVGKEITGINENTVPTVVVLLYPNPVTENWLKIKTGIYDTYLVTITDISGRTVYNNSLIGEELTIDLNNVKSGLHIVNIVSKSFSFSSKIIVK